MSHMQSTDAPRQGRKRKAEAHSIVEMCLTSGRRAYLSFVWAVKLLQSPKRRRMAGGGLPWGSFNVLQHTYLHQAVIGASKGAGPAGNGAAALAGRTAPGTDAPGRRRLRQTPRSVPQRVAEVVDLTLSDASGNSGMNSAREDTPRDSSPASASHAGTASTQPSTRPTAASQLAALPPSSAADEEPCSSRACKGRGVPSALLVARAGTPLLSALRAKRPQPKPSACVATTPAGPSTNLQPVTSADLGRLLRGKGWLNDEVVNFYMLLIMKREAESGRSSEAAAAAPQPVADAEATALGLPGSRPASTPARRQAAPASSPHQHHSCPSKVKPASAVGARGGEAVQQAVPGAAETGLDVAAAMDAHLEAAPSERPLMTPGSPVGQRSPLKQVVSAVAAAAGNGGVAAALAAAVVTTAAGLGAAVAASARRLAPRRRRHGSSAAAAAVAAEDPPPVCVCAAAAEATANMPCPIPGPVPSFASGDQLLAAAPAAATRQRATVFAFNSFFFSKLTGKGNRKCFEYDEVRRWTQPCRTHTPDCVLTRDLLLFPINHGNAHWCLAAVWPRRRLLQYFDSLGSGRGTSDWVLDTLQRWLLTDAEDKQVTLGSEAATPTAAAARAGGAMTRDGWRKEASELRIPAQLDGCSCGVFVCAFAELLARGVPPYAFGFCQTDIPAIRCGMAEQTLRGAL